jgi:hypothetical protein
MAEDCTPDGKGQGGQAGTMSHEEPCTCTLAVVVEAADLAPTPTEQVVVTVGVPTA